MKNKSKAFDTSALPRWHFLYSKYMLNDFSSKVIFPKSNPLNFLSVSHSSARTLVRYIFVERLTGKQKIMKHNCSKRKCLFCNELSAYYEEAQPYRFLTDERRAFFSDKCSVASSSSSKFTQIFAPAVFPKESHSNIVEEEKSKFVETFQPALEKVFLKQTRNRKKHVTKHLRKAIQVCYSVLKNVKKHKANYLLNVHCKLPFENFDEVNSSTKRYGDVICTPNHPNVFNHKVFLFLRSVIKKTFPLTQVWGTKKNESSFLMNLKMFLSCRRFDKISINDLVAGISVDHIPWISGPNADVTFNKFIDWLLIDFVFVLLKRFFYVTEHSDSRNRLYYYRKNVWNRLVSRGSKVIVDDGIWSRDPSPCSQVQFNVRFCPKKLGLRPITKVVNSEKHNLMPAHEILVILRHICSKYPLLLGCSALGRKDVHLAWKEFWNNCQKYCRLYNLPSLQFYIAKMDVHRCFDTIPVQLLLQIIREILDRTSRVEIIHLTKLKKKYTRVSDCSNEILKTLTYFLKNVRLDVMGKKFVKIKGIPQGWCLSALLCNIFYGNLERNYLRSFLNKQTFDAESNQACVKLMIRFTDDYMFVSSSRDETIAFIKKMQHGFSLYGFKINWKKTCLNFITPPLDVAEASHINVLPEHEAFQWYGFLFPTRFNDREINFLNISSGTSNAGGVSIDLSRYSALGNIRDTITVAPSANEYTIFLSLSKSLRLRANAICFDAKINSYSRILRNVYELAIVTSLQWLAHQLCKPNQNRVECSGIAALNISRLAAVLLASIRKKLPGQKFPNRSLVIWIFYKAFYKKLIRHQTTFKKVSFRLISGMKMHQTKLSRHRNWKHLKQLLRSATSFCPYHLRTISVR